MVVIEVLLFFTITLLSGYLVLRLFKNDSFLYAIGMGLMVNMIVGVIANFTFGINLRSILLIYLIVSIILFALNRKMDYHLPKINWKSALIPICIYVFAVLMQWQTTLVSSNLIGSDIHLEYFVANDVLVNGYWNPNIVGTTINSCLGITILLPFYSLLTGMDLMGVFKIISPLIFAFMPVILYKVFKPQFGKLTAVLATVFFITMPMFTMDMTQLIRQQQAELFFVLVIMVILDTMPFRNKIILGTIFSLGAVTTHYGMTIGFVGYLLIGFVIMLILLKVYRNKVVDSFSQFKPRLAMVIIACISLILYFGYYTQVNSGQVLTPSTIPAKIVESTINQAKAGVGDKPMNPPADMKDLSKPQTASTTTTPIIVKDSGLPDIIKRFPFLNPFWREPLLQTAIGLDFGRASILGQIWRVFQYIIEVCLIVGFISLLIRPPKRIRLEFMAFVVASIFVIAGMYLLSTYSYGMGATRVWQVTLIFMSPLVIIGIRRIVGLLRIHKDKAVLGVSLVILIPYMVFNSGVVFEIAKLQPVGFIDVPYSVALSGYRADVATVFDDEDVIAVEWLKENVKDPNRVVFSDAHGVRLLIQRFGIPLNPYSVSGGNLVAGTNRLIDYLKADSEGYIFLRKLNVDRNTITEQGEYASRKNANIDDIPIIRDAIQNGEILYDNGARIIRIK